MQYTCQVCGNIFQDKPSHPRKFCSRECMGKGLKRVPITKLTGYICSTCGDTFWRYPSLKQRYCSRVCKNKAREVQVPLSCEQCGREFTVNPAQIGRRQFCSKRCRAIVQQTIRGPDHPNWRGGPQPFYYGPNWEAQRNAARQRDNYCCHYCGKTEPDEGRQMSVHHIVPFRTFGYVPDQNQRYLAANELSNLICLCCRCHALAEIGNIPIQIT